MSIEFSNPENLPVEKLTLSVSNDGIIQDIKALHLYWAEKRLWTMFEKPPMGSSLITGALDAWKSKADSLIDDLKCLLSLEHHKFWSTIIYSPKSMDMLVSFLQEANPPYMRPYEIREIQKLYEEIRRLVLIVFSRLVSYKESKSKWISKPFMSDLLYQNFIFTIPIIWDICLVYGGDNTQHISKLLNAIFELQPKYTADTEQALKFVSESFKYIILQVNKDYEATDPPNLPETFQGFSEINRPSSSAQTGVKLSFDVLRDMVIHLVDTAMTLRIFLEAYSNAAEIFRKTNFILSIAQLYEYGIPLLYDKLENLGTSTNVSYSEVEGYIDATRAELIDIFREILAVYKNKIFNEEGNVLSRVEEYLAVMLDGLSEKLMIRDYHSSYPVHEDIEMLREAFPDIDSVKTDFILQAVYSNLEEPPIDDLPNAKSDNRKERSESVNSKNVSNTSVPTRDHEIPDNIKEESLISEVKDILPHLGDGFILKCLEHYGFNSERVVNSLLEGNLAEPLRGLDQSLPIIPQDALDNNFLETGISRLNVFDGDKFDLITRDDVDLSKMHVGKRQPKHKNLAQLLDDKEEVRQMRDIYSKYDLVCDNVSMYSDEYDDTYDSEAVLPGADNADDLGRPFVTPRALQSMNKPDQESSSEESTPGDTEPPNPSEVRNRMNFCMNPEEIRARREANYRGRGRGRPGPPATQNKNIDVVGKAKGQGQEKSVLKNRDKKEKNKSARGNHSRRQGAQWKRSQGMMPS